MGTVTLNLINLDFLKNMFALHPPLNKRFHVKEQFTWHSCIKSTKIHEI
jgi:hypothetical protein